MDFELADIIIIYYCGLLFLLFACSVFDVFNCDIYAKSTRSACIRSTGTYSRRTSNDVSNLTWFYDAKFAPNLYRRWLGLRVDNQGGEEFEMTEDKTKDDETVASMRGGEGRMCLPPMLIHPVKDVELPVEVIPEGLEPEGQETDPSA